MASAKAALSNPAGKLELLMALYTSGVLCNCSQVEHCWDEDGVLIEELRHDNECEAKFKIMGILSETNET